MISRIVNENFGYDVACDGPWVAVGNPNSFIATASIANLNRTGSVEIYKYNINTDTHDKKVTLYRPTDGELILLSTETNNTASGQGPQYIVHTELTGSVPLIANFDIQLDAGIYFTASGDGYGLALDIKNNVLAIGDNYFISSMNVGTQSFTFTGSGGVDIFDLSKLDVDPYAARSNPVITGTTLSSGFYNVQISVPANQGFGFVSLEARDSSIPNSQFQINNQVAVSNTGGNITINTNFSSLVNIELRATGIVSVNPYLTSVSNPNSIVTSSFGTSLSINDEWLAVGSKYESGSKGNVFMFRKLGGPTGNAGSWSFYQSITPPAEITTGDWFGHAISLNKASGSYSGSMVIGSTKPSGSNIFQYEFSGNLWTRNFTISPDYTTIHPLTFYPTFPQFSGSFPNYFDGFGWDVAIYKDTIVVGAPFDRNIFEYSGSSKYDQGAVYFFERCPNRNVGYYLARKSYGNEKILKNNNLGISVDVRGNYAVAGSPKLYADSASICYLRGSLFQQNFCGEDVENTLNGQYVLYTKDTGSISGSSIIDWDIVNVYQTKKRILQPYRDYGFDVGICDSFVVVGAPMFISGSSRNMDLTAGTASFTGSVNNLGNLSGKSYIYNLNNLREQFYVGNAFYRNGKLVIMSSGSSFDGLLLNNSGFYEYQMDFQSKQIIYEKQIVCPVDPGEFNVSTNPTAIVLPTSSFDINRNGVFDFQDCDVLLRYMKYKSTEAGGHPITDWSSSIINNNTDEEMSVYNLYSGLYSGTDALFTSSYTNINTNLSADLDLNRDTRIDVNDMNILWKYFINRLTQRNYDTYVTPNSQKKFLSDIIDFLNVKTMKNIAPAINANFLDYNRLSTNDPTGSYLAPYTTAIGLYSGTDLVAIAKLGSPIKITPSFPMNFCIKIDF